MHILRPWALALLCLAAAATAQDGDLFVAKSKEAQRIAPILARLEAVGLSGSALLALDGKVLVAMGVGLADAENAKANGANTLFDLSMLTSHFTAAAVHVLDGQRKLAIDDRLAKHLPDVPAECAGITLRHLLDHTSGLPVTNAAKGDDAAAAVRSLLAGRPAHPPGTHHEYWPAGYALLTEVIARASGQAYPEFCRERLFRAAAMDHACFIGDPAPRDAQVAVAVAGLWPARGALDRAAGAEGFGYRGTFGVVACVWDLWRWDRALAGRKLLGKRQKELVLEPDDRGYALGFRIERNSGRLVLRHSTSGFGFASELRRYPERDGCLVILSNANVLSMTMLASLIEATLFGEPRPEPPDPLPEGLQSALVGAWSDGNGASWEVARAGVATAVKAIAAAGESDRRCYVGAGEKDELALFKWMTVDRVAIERDAKGQIEALRWNGRRLVRSK